MGIDTRSVGAELDAAAKRKLDGIENAGADAGLVEAAKTANEEADQAGMRADEAMDEAEKSVE